MVILYVNIMMRDAVIICLLSKTNIETNIKVFITVECFFFVSFAGNNQNSNGKLGNIFVIWVSDHEQMI